MPSRAPSSWVLTALDVVAALSLAGWAYVAVHAALRPDALSHAILPGIPLRRDTFGAVSFLLSALSFFVLDALRPEASAARRSTDAEG